MKSKGQTSSPSNCSQEESQEEVIEQLRQQENLLNTLEHNLSYLAALIQNTKEKIIFLNNKLSKSSEHQNEINQVIEFDHKRSQLSVVSQKKTSQKEQIICEQNKEIIHKDNRVKSVKTQDQLINEPARKQVINQCELNNEEEDQASQIQWPIEQQISQDQWQLDSDSDSQENAKQNTQTCEYDERQKQYRFKFKICSQYSQSSIYNDGSELDQSTSSISQSDFQFYEQQARNQYKEIFGEYSHYIFNSHFLSQQELYIFIKQTENELCYHSVYPISKFSKMGDELSIEQQNYLQFKEQFQDQKEEYLNNNENVHYLNQVLQRNRNENKDCANQIQSICFQISFDQQSNLNLSQQIQSQESSSICNENNEDSQQFEYLNEFIFGSNEQWLYQYHTKLQLFTIGINSIKQE